MTFVKIMNDFIAKTTRLHHQINYKILITQIKTVKYLEYQFNELNGFKKKKNFSFEIVLIVYKMDGK